MNQFNLIVITICATFMVTVIVCYLFVLIPFFRFFAKFKQRVFIEEETSFNEIENPRAAISPGEKENNSCPIIIDREEV